MQLRFLPVVVRDVLPSYIFSICYFQGIRIDGFGRQSESLLSRERREQAERPRGTDAK
jgi:hypothetical protein